MATAPRISVVIPTYREVDNLEAVSESVREALEPCGWSYEILFVDDDSRDGSEELASDLASVLPVRMIVRLEERGLSSAVIRGIEEARGEFVVVMDADLSHPAERIPDMIRKLETGENDFALGSRYVAGGDVDREWTWFRRCNSLVATWLARPLVKVRDPMSGFFAFARRQMPDPGELSPIGYKIGLELLVKGRFERPCEVPILFRDRQHGESKLSLREQLRYLQHLNRLYHHRYRTRWELLQFGLVGATGFLVDVAFYLALQWAFGVQHLVARGLSFWAAASWNWAWNRRLTFASRRRTRKRVQWPAFLLSSSIGFVLNWGTYYALTSHISFFADGAPRLLALFLGVLVGMGLNFVLARTFVFLPALAKRADDGEREEGLDEPMPLSAAAPASELPAKRERKVGRAGA